MRRLSILWVSLALTAAACGGSTAETTTTVTTAASTTTATQPTTTVADTSTTPTTVATTTTYVEGTTVTTYPAAFASPLNGLPADVEINLDRRAIGIKIDNHANARPQSGVLEADMVVENRVEAGITRFIAFYHDNDSDYVGPIRSLRPTDSTIAAAIGAPLVISGGQDWVQQLTAGRGVGLIGPGAAKMIRISSRLAPHNEYGDTAKMRAGADAQGYADTPPHPLYTIDEWDYPDEVATRISLDWSDYTEVEWEYVDGEYYRYQDGAAHEAITRDGTRTQMHATVLVVLEGDFYTQYPSGVGTAVPATDTAGSGPAYVFARGRVWHGTWQRAQYTDQFTLISADGSEAVVPPGFAWVSVFPEQRSVTWS